MNKYWQIVFGHIYSNIPKKTVLVMCLKMSELFKNDEVAGPSVVVL